MDSRKDRPAEKRGADDQNRTANLGGAIGVNQSLTISAKPVGVGAVCRRLILVGEQSGLLTHIAAMESGSLCVRMKG